MFCPSYRTHGLPYSSSVWKTRFAIICQLAMLRNKCSDMFCHVLKRIFCCFNMFWCTSFPMFHHVPQCSAMIRNTCSVMFNHVRACSAMFHLLVKERISFIFKFSFFLLPKYNCSSIYVALYFNRFGNLNWCLNACSPFFLLFRTIVELLILIAQKKGSDVLIAKKKKN